MSHDIDFLYEPQGKTLEQYILSEEQRTIVIGPLGSGKTNASCWKGFRITCAQEPDSRGVRKVRGVAVRNTYSDLLSTTVKDWLDMFEDLGRYVGGGREPPTHYLNFDLEDGTSVEAEVMFIAFDRPEHVKKARGLQATWVWINEAKELSKAVVDMLDLRVGRYPKDVPPTWYGMFGDTNAPDDDHWLYQFAEEDKPEGWRILKQPGGVIKVNDKWVVNPAAENVANLPPGYYEKGLQGKKEDWIKVNLANEYGFVIDGKPVHPDYLDSTHCRPFELNPRLPILMGMDFGLTPAAVFAQRHPMGGWRIRTELVATRMGAQNFGAEIQRHLAERYSGYEVGGLWGDPAGDAEAQTDENTPFRILRAQNIDATPAPTNDTGLRYGAVDASLTRLIDGQPGLLVHPDCKQLRKALAGGYCFRRLAVAGGTRYADKVEKNMYSHVAEALQYLLVGAGEHKPLVTRVRATPRPRRAITD